MKTKTIDRLREKASKIGVTLDDDGYVVHFDAPSGYVWRANHLPALNMQYATNSESWLSQAVRSFQTELKEGLVKVTDPEEIKSFRWDLDDDNWGASAEAPVRLEWPI